MKHGEELRKECLCNKNFRKGVMNLCISVKKSFWKGEVQFLSGKTT